jgi:Lrp/AsnC family leucine-responsive transcriptional regulator
MGNKSKLSRENTAYRLERLLKENIIKTNTAIINTNALGFRQYALFIQLSKIDKQKESKIIASLKEHKSVSWIGILTGKWSLVLDVYAENEKQLAQSIYEILDLCKEHIGEYALLPLEYKEYYMNKVINSNPAIFKSPSSKKVELDKTDLKILMLLNMNSRISYANLSNKIDLTANGIKKRIKKLEKDQIIIGYTSLINHKSFGFEWYGLQLKLLKFDAENINKLVKYFKENKRVIFYYRYFSGLWDFDIGILVKDSLELREFINELRDKFSDIIKINDFFLLLEEISDNSLPKIVFENNN